MKRSIPLTVGLVLSSFLALGDIVTLPLSTEGPPLAVRIIGAVLGVGTVAGVVLTWRSRLRTGAVLVVVTRLLSGLTAVPAFLVPDAPAEAKGMAAVGIAATVLAVALVSPALRNRTVEVTP